MDIEILIPLGGIAMTAWIVYTVVEGLRRFHQQRVLSQFQSKLLERIGNVTELAAFLNTDAGERLLKGLMPLGEAGGPHVRILRAVQSGAVLTILGTALFAYGWMTPTLAGGLTNAINAIATILLGLGLGFFASAVLSYRLSKQMGLLGPTR